MSREVVLYLGPVGLAALLTLSLAGVAWRRSAPGAKTFSSLMLAIGVWSIGYALELSLPTLALKVFWAKAQYLSIVFVPLIFFLFIARYTQTAQTYLRQRRLLAGLSVIPLLTLGLVWSNELHGLVWSGFDLIPHGALVFLQVTHGPWFWVHVAYSYLLLLGAFSLAVRALWRPGVLYRSQVVILLVGSLCPWLGNMVYLFDINPLPYLDPTPMAFALSGVVMAYGLFRSHLLQAVPIAREVVIEYMHDAVLVFDGQLQIIDANPAAERWLGRLAPELVGHTAETVLGHWPELVAACHTEIEAQTEIVLSSMGEPRYYDVRVSSLADLRRHLPGRLLIARDITERKRAEAEQQRLEETMRRQALIFESITESVILTDQHSRIVDCNPATEALFGYTKAEMLGQTALLWHAQTSGKRTTPASARG